MDARADPGRRPYLIFASATLFYWAALYAYVPVLPAYAATLGASLTQVGIVVAAYGLGQLIFRLPVGLFSDQIGRRKPFCLAGLVASCVGSAMMYWSPNPTWLIVGRGITGVSAAAWVPITVMFAEYFPQSQGARVMAVLTFLSGVAQLASTLIGGWIADQLGWTASFALGFGFGIAGLVLLSTVPERRPAIRPTSRRTEVARIAARPRLIRIALIGALLQFAVWATTFAFLPVFARGLGATPTDLGLLAGSSLVCFTLAALVMSRWRRETASPRLAVAGLALVAGSVIVIPFLHAFSILVITQAVAGVGQGIVMPMLLGLSIEGVEPGEKATAMGLFQAVYALGMFLGPAAAGVIADGIGLGPAFLVSALLCGLGAGLLATTPTFQAASLREVLPCSR